MNAKIIIIGNEILSGFTRDLNANFLIKSLLKKDVIVDNVVFIKDEISLIHRELKITRSTDLVFLTGGLGPTSDDVTSRALDTFFSPIKPRLLENQIGTASGLWYKKDQIDYFSFPGVPSEMRLMVSNLFSAFFSKKEKQNSFFQVNTIGIPESKLSSLLNDFENGLPPTCKLSYLPDNIIVKLRFHDSSGQLKGFELLKRKLNQILGSFIFSYGEKSLQQSLVFTLIKKNIKIAIAESCTGGQISKMLTSVPGASKVFIGSVIAYSNFAKKTVLDVSSSNITNNGVVSEQVVIEMAQSVREKFNSNFGLATSGYMGPFEQGGGERIAWFCVASKDKIITEKINLKSTRSNNIVITSRSVLNELRKQIL